MNANQREVPCRNERRFFNCLSDPDKNSSGEASFEKSASDLLMERAFANSMRFLVLFAALGKKNNYSKSTRSMIHLLFFRSKKK